MDVVRFALLAFPATKPGEPRCAALPPTTEGNHPAEELEHVIHFRTNFMKIYNGPFNNWIYLSSLDFRNWERVNH